MSLLNAVTFMALALLPLSAHASICTPGAAVDILWGGKWWPGQVRQGPDEQGRCYISYDNYSSTWDAWMKPETLRARATPTPSPAASRPAKPAVAARLAVAFVAKRDDCVSGERIMTRAGQAGTVTSVGQIGSCFVTLDDGGKLAVPPSQLHSLSNNQGQVRGLPALTVYMCNSPEIMIRADVSFSLRPGNRYVHFDGKRGQYRYDSNTAMLHMLSGPLRGFAYHRFSASAFSLMQNGQASNVSCVSSPVKNPDAPPW